MAKISLPKMLGMSFMLFSGGVALFLLFARIAEPLGVASEDRIISLALLFLGGYFVWRKG